MCAYIIFTKNYKRAKVRVCWPMSDQCFILVHSIAQFGIMESIQVNENIDLK